MGSSTSTCFAARVASAAAVTRDHLLPLVTMPMSLEVVIGAEPELGEKREDLVQLLG